MSVAAAPAALQDLPDAILAALITAVDPWRFGGIVVRSRAGPHRDRWLAWFRSLLAPGTPVRRLPAHADDSRITGGLDLAATLAAGRPVAERGILAETDGGVLVVPMAERLAPSLAARLGAVVDRGGVESSAGTVPARLGLIALDEGADDDEQLSAALAERMAFRIAIAGNEALRECALGGAAVAAAARLFPAVRADDAILDALEGTALALGVGSLRASGFALRAARAAAALDGRSRVEQADAALAARLVLAPRTTRLPAERPPAPPETADPPPADDAPEPPTDAPDRDPTAEQPIEALADVVLAAAKTSIPAGLLDRLRVETLLRMRGASPAGAGARQAATRRGRPIGVRRGVPTAGIRLNVIETLRAAAPWQRLRARSFPQDAAADPAAFRLAIRRDDLRVTRFAQRTQTTTIFVVDASGSLAASRLAEAKGAVELLLADCYVRRDEVALLAFRGQRADLLLPPTRSLARAKRSLADLPGGGATPLAGAIDAASALADQIRRRGRTPVIVFLTDGRANVARDGSTGRTEATRDALAAGRGLAATGLRTLVVDAAMRPQSSAEALAVAMGAVYVPLPRADASALSHAVRAATPA